MGVENERRRRSRSLRLPSPAMCVALLALFVGLTSGAYATAKFKHGPKGIVNAQDIAFNTITGAEIKNRSVFPADLSGSALKGMKGTKGATGPAGPAGPQGGPGVNGVNGINGFGRLDYNSDGPWVNDASTINRGYALCDSGLHATGGGVLPQSGFQYVVGQGPGDAAGNVNSLGWNVLMANSDSVNDYTFTVYVICANASQVTKAKASSGAQFGASFSARKAR